MDHVIPLDELKKTIVELEKFRKDYSHESAALIGDTKTLLMNGEDDYFSASQNVYKVFIWYFTLQQRLPLLVTDFNLVF